MLLIKILHAFGISESSAPCFLIIYMKDIHNDMKFISEKISLKFSIKNMENEDSTVNHKIIISYSSLSHRKALLCVEMITRYYL